MRGLYLFIGGTLSRLFRAFAGKLGNTRRELGWVGRIVPGVRVDTDRTNMTECFGWRRPR
jgi:hypothetical protein